MNYTTNYFVGQIVWYEDENLNCDPYVIIKVKDETVIIKNSYLYCEIEVPKDKIEPLTEEQVREELAYCFGL